MTGLRQKHRRRVALSCIASVCTVMLSTVAAARSIREEHQDAYANQLKNTPSIFATTPIYHIVPEENTITFAAAVNRTDATVGPLGSNVSSDRQNLSSLLTYEGWSGSPYIGFSSREFGIGFTGSVGEMQSDFKMDTMLSESSLRYSGVGLFLYYSPKISMLPKSVDVSVFVGGNSLNAVQEQSTDWTSDSTTSSATKYRYSVQSYTRGCNVGIHLAKRFIFIPWFDFSNNQVGKVTTANNGREFTVTSSTDLQDSMNLYWHTMPTWRYGIDFAVTLGLVDVHFGGLLGALGSINKGTDRISDQSNQFSLSMSMKGS